MSEGCSPHRLPCRVHSTFEIAVPITELPPDPDAVAMSPGTLLRSQEEIDNLLKNAKCEEGTSMDSIATYIPSKAVRKQMEEEAARAKEEMRSRKAAKIAELEAQISNLRRDSFDDEAVDSTKLEQLAITRPVSMVSTEVENSEKIASSTRSSLSSPGSVTVVPSPTIGALVAAPPAIGALMGASPAIGAMVVAALQPATHGRPLVDGEDQLEEDFQIVHNELTHSMAMDKSNKRQR